MEIEKLLESFKFDFGAKLKEMLGSVESVSEKSEDFLLKL